MTDDGIIIPEYDVEVSSPEKNLVEQLSSGKYNKYGRFVMAALSAIPWVGSFIGAMASLSGENEQDKINELQMLWVAEHKEKIAKLQMALDDIFNRLENIDQDLKDRIESEEYLNLVRLAFRSWDEADTEDKRQMLKRLITNAGASKLCSDDLIRLFIGWINLYHESHFAVMKEIFKNPGVTRYDIWTNIHGEIVREDSSEADLFRYLIRELSMGGVIRQSRETNEYGQFMKHQRGRGSSRSSTMESAFEDTKPYELTELGKEFIHYVLNDVVPRISEQ